MTVMIRTSLSRARGQNLNVISAAQRLNEMQPIEPKDIDATEIGRARYMTEISQRQVASSMLKAASVTLRESLAAGCRCRWMVVGQKQETSITDSVVFLKKLRSSLFLERAEYRLLCRLLDGDIAKDIFEGERKAQAVSKVIDS
jgi:hypothetical protein